MSKNIKREDGRYRNLSTGRFTSRAAWKSSNTKERKARALAEARKVAEKAAKREAGKKRRRGREREEAPEPRGKGEGEITDRGYLGGA
jgi:hypothetical protein